MEYLWVILTLIAAFVQTSRNGFMKHLKSNLNDQTIMFARFLFSIPFLFLLLGGLKISGYLFPQTNINFILYASLASVFQIVAGLLFLKILSRRNFVIGVTYIQTDSMMKALFAAILFGERISTNALFAIILNFIGVLLITIVEKHLVPKNLIKRIFTPSAIMGVGSGICFGLTGVFIRQAILSLEGGEFFVRSAYTLSFILTLQIIILFAVLFAKNKDQIKKIIRLGSAPYLVGLANAVSSFCFFMAFSLTQAAYVSMVGQIEIVFSLFLTHKIFKEEIAPLEILGMAIIVGSIMLLVYLN